MLKDIQSHPDKIAPVILVKSENKLIVLDNTSENKFPGSFKYVFLEHFYQVTISDYLLDIKYFAAKQAFFFFRIFPYSGLN